jgi:hypothetical protein
MMSVSLPRTYPHCLSNSAARYPARMTDLILTPVLAAALASRPRQVVHKGEGGGKLSPHNFVAKGAKPRVGAPRGNRNAAVRDPAVLERRARHAAAQAVIDETLALADAAIAVAEQDLLARKRLPMLVLTEAGS